MQNCTPLCSPLYSLKRFLGQPKPNLMTLHNINDFAYIRLDKSKQILHILKDV